ncbi:MULTISPECIES: VCBS repeat-containing protein [unclassified Ruegeria]|uniref:FG-GAP repeat domain-containing protein n=1 Tax=unclassified Ruegeria TaxID=2625375 RepID=UPI001488845C|nr:MULTISPECIES: VCBS repeat-containing protein [unclassified Ruegeria]NOD63694.1 VCBS repeat-containing protein [Ruegeria sp. HKCCD6109]
MHSKAPRTPARIWQGRARGALTSLCLWGSTFGAATAADQIKAAKFTEPTTRYAHGVLGDAVEYGALELRVQITGSNPKTVTVRLPKDRVFEDLSPRLIDIDADGTFEAIVVESQDQQGAQLAIYNASGTKIAATPHIGTRFRWLAPIGAADLDGDGHIEIAYIDRPHLAKTLRVWRYKDNALTEIASISGLTNHKIGEDFISGGVGTCGDRPELIVASADWSRIVSVSYDNGWTKTDLGPFKGSNSLAQALNC